MKNNSHQNSMLKKSLSFGAAILAVITISAIWIQTHNRPVSVPHPAPPLQSPKDLPRQIQKTYLGKTYLIMDSKDPSYTPLQLQNILSDLMNIKPKREFPTFPLLIDYLDELEVPGYGSSSGGFGTVLSCGQFTFISVEVPVEQTQTRAFIYRRDNVKDSSSASGPPYRYIEEFMHPGIPWVIDFREAGDSIEVFMENTGVVVHHLEIMPEWRKGK